MCARDVKEGKRSLVGWALGALLDVGVAVDDDEVTVVSFGATHSSCDAATTNSSACGEAWARDVGAGKRRVVGWALAAPLDVGVAVDEFTVVSLRRSTRGA